jgi:hypothetical protein
MQPATARRVHSHTELVLWAAKPDAREPIKRQLLPSIVLCIVVGAMLPSGQPVASQPLFDGGSPQSQEWQSPLACGGSGGICQEDYAALTGSIHRLTKS